MTIEDVITIMKQKAEEHLRSADDWKNEAYATLNINQAARMFHYAEDDREKANIWTEAAQLLASLPS